MPYLTYSEGRNAPWTEHARYPTKAIANYVNGDIAFTRNRKDFWVYEVSSDRMTVTLLYHFYRGDPDA